MSLVSYPFVATELNLAVLDPLETKELTYTWRHVSSYFLLLSSRLIMSRKLGIKED